MRLLFSSVFSAFFPLVWLLQVKIFVIELISDIPTQRGLFTTPSAFRSSVSLCIFLTILPPQLICCHVAGNPHQAVLSVFWVDRMRDSQRCSQKAVSRVHFLLKVSLTRCLGGNKSSNLDGWHLLFRLNVSVIHIRIVTACWLLGKILTHRIDGSPFGTSVLWIFWDVWRPNKVPLGVSK